MLNPGMILGNRYEIVSKIGTGGMADVYKGNDLKLNRFVAIKVLKSEFSSNKNFVSKFKVEAQSAASLMHHNIVNVYDVGEENGLYYFVMELVEGITLKNYIEKKIRLSYKEALSIAIQVSNGIEAAHNNGIIHRDIKPQNIIISREGKVKVADFGIARAASSDTVTSHAMGSVHYTSPEQARGGYSDAKSDIYSIGITIFEMVTGRVPFDGETTVSIAIKHIQEEMPSPRIYIPDLPVSVEKIILKCTQKNSERRYHNIGELIKDLKQACITPDDDFVVIQEAMSNEGTKVITEADRARGSQAPQGAAPAAPERGMAAGPAGNAQGSYENAQSYNVNDQSMYGRNIYSQYADEDADDYDDGELNAFPMGAQYRDPYQNQQMPYQGQQAVPYQGQQAGYQGQLQGQFNGPVNNRYNAPGFNEDDLSDEEWEEYDRQRRLEEKRAKKEAKQAKKNKKQASSKKQYERYDDRYDARRDGSSRPKNAGSNQRGRDSLDDSDMDPNMERLMTILMIVAAIVVAAVAIVLVFKVTGLSGKGGLKKAEAREGYTFVPDVVGLDINEASSVLSEAGLKAQASYAESTEYDKDIICSQDIAEGEEVEEGTVLKLIISSGKVAGSLEMEIEPESSGGMKLAVPDVVGKSEAEAKVAIENEGFVMVKELIKSDAVEKGKVISQNPLGATNAPKGSNINVVISDGPDTSESTVPDIVGKTKEEAMNLLSDAGFLFNTPEEESNDAVEAGKVISQTVAAGTTMTTGTYVDFKVSKGPAGYSCSFAVNAPADYLQGTEAVILLLDPSGAQIESVSTTTFPYSLVKSGITGASSGVVTITYQKLDGSWDTTSPASVTFVQE